MAEVTEVKTVAELNPQTPPPFVASTEGLTPPMDDNAVKAIFAQAAANGVDDLNASIVIPAQTNGQPEPVGAAVSAPVDVPKKFQKPDGTVDEEKLKTSSTQLDEAIEQKQKSIEEILAEYKEREKKFQELGETKKQLTANPPAIPSMPQPQGALDPNMEAVRQQLLALQQQDPIAFAVEIAKAVSRKEAADIAAPALQVAHIIAERERDAGRRENLTKLAEEDPRVLGPLYAELLKEMDSDPGYMKLKNPHKAAWNEVKGRLRLGEAPQRQAQPSNASPMLGRGTPTPVSGLPNPQNPTTLFQQAKTVDPYSQEGKALEDQLRAITGKLWQ